MRLGPEERQINRRGMEGRLKPDFPSDKRGMIPLMEEILHYLGCINSSNDGIFTISAVAGFLPSIVELLLPMPYADNIHPSYETELIPGKMTWLFGQSTF